MKKVILLSLILLTHVTMFAQQRYNRETNTARIMSYNIRNGKGLDNKTDYQRTARVIESVSPDVLLVQEVDSMTGRSGGVDVINHLADITKMHAVYAPAIDYDGGKYGTGMLSKQRPISAKHIALPGREEARVLLVAEFEQYVVMGVHLSLTAEDREASMQIIEREALQWNKPVFVAGDFNAEPDSKEMKMLANNWKTLNNTKVPTFPADKPVDKIDYILGHTAKGHTYSVVQNQVLNEPEASDHRPLFADVRLKADAGQVMRTLPYLQNPSPEGMTVMWLTNVPCRSWVEYGTDPTQMKRARTFVEGEAMANNMVNRIRLEGLRPGTTYYYRAVSQEITLYGPYHKEFGDTVRTPVASFTTWDDNQKDFTALIFNDIHDRHPIFDRLFAQVKDTGYDFVVFNGDCIADVQTEDIAVRSISHYSKTVGGDRIPTLFLRGNHETRGAYSMFLWNLLEKKGGTHTYDGFNVGDTRFVLLDCGEDKPDDHWVYYDMNDFTHYRQEQAEFLKKEIASPAFKKAAKRVLIHHIPIYSKNMDEYSPCKDLWGEILAKAPFNISFNAHTHRYEYIPKGQDGNNYPVMIGGGPDETATVGVLEKKGNKMTLNVVNIKGESVLKLDL